MAVGSEVVLRVLAGIGGPVPSTKLVKLVYLVDYVYFQHYGRTLTGFQYEWDHYGPDAVGHAVVGEAHDLAERDLVKITCYPNICGGLTTNFAARVDDAEAPSFSPEAEMVIEDVIKQYSRLSITQITALTKRTTPFKRAVQYSLLSMEQSTPVGHTDEEDWEAYQRDLKENGTFSLDEVKRKIP